MHLSSIYKPALLALIAATLSACTLLNRNPAPAVQVEKSTPAMPAAHSDMPTVVLPPKVTGVGYGALPTQEGLSNEQRRLMAMRASKLDAYRSLAETIAGLKLTGNTTVSAVTISNDSFRVYVEAYLRGARVLTVTPMPGGSYETVLELTLGGDFYRDVVNAVQGQPVGAPVMTTDQPRQPVPVDAKPAIEPAKPVASNNPNFYLAH